MTPEIPKNKVHVLAVLASLMSICATTVAQVRYELVARAGMTTPSGGTLDFIPDLPRPRIDQLGRVAFIGEDVMSPGGQVRRLFVSRGSGLEVMISEGDAVRPGGPTITDLARLWRFTDGGELVYEVNLSNGNSGIYRHAFDSQFPTEYLQIGPTGVAPERGSLLVSREGDLLVIARDPDRLITVLDGIVRESFFVFEDSPAPDDYPILTGFSYSGVVQSTDGEPNAIVTGEYENQDGSQFSTTWLAGASTEPIITTDQAVPGMLPLAWNGDLGLAQVCGQRFQAFANLLNTSSPGGMAIWEGSELRLLDQIENDFSGYPESAIEGTRRGHRGGGLIAKTGIGDLYFSIWDYWDLGQEPRLIAGNTLGGVTPLPVNDGTDAITSAGSIQANASGSVVIDVGTLQSGATGMLCYVAHSKTWHHVGSDGEMVTIDKGPFAGQQIAAYNRFEPGPVDPYTDSGLLMTEGFENDDSDAGYIMILDLRSLPGYAIPADLDGDGRVDIEDLYYIHQNPEDINGDGVADAEDKRALERYIRRNEIEDMSAGRR